MASLVAAVWICYRLLRPHNKEENELLLKNKGYVYLLRARDYYKIGRSKDFKRRLREIKLQLPFPVEQVHVVMVDDMLELENLWHQRFKAKRKNGEWFLLSDNDVRESKRQ